MNWLELIADPTFQTVLLGTTSIGFVSGALGCFAYLRRQSLVGDVIAHSSLFGVMLFFLISYLLTGQGSKSLFVLVPGAAVSGFLSLWICQWLVRNRTVREDSGLGVMLAIFFGTGILLLRCVQRSEPPIPGHRGLEGYIFGMAASMTRSDLIMIAILGAASIIAILVFWKELKAYTFDAMFSHGLGIRHQVMDALLIALLVTGIVIGVQCIGVVLMIAMLVIPAAAARQWTRSLGRMVMLAAVIGAACGVTGSVVSASVDNMPTGPVMVLAGVIIFLISILFAPGRGVLVRRSGLRSGRQSLQEMIP